MEQMFDLYEWEAVECPNCKGSGYVTEVNGMGETYKNICPYCVEDDEMEHVPSFF